MNLRRKLGRSVCVYALCAVSAVVMAAETGITGVGTNVIEFPSLWRVALGFTVTVGLLIAGVYLGRSHWLRLTVPGARSAQAHVRSRTRLSGLLLTVIDVEGQRILVTESRRGLHVVNLPQTGVAPESR